MAVADFDNDGDLDIIVNTNPGDCGKAEMPPVLLQNHLGQNREWLVLELVGETSNRDALGAQVRIHYRGGKAMRHVNAGCGYASQSDRRLFFGLGDASVVDSLEVVWPTGKKQQFKNVKSKQRLVLHEGGILKPWSAPAPAAQVASNGDSR